MFEYLVKISLIIGLLQSSQSMADIIDGEEFLDPTRPFYLDLSEPDEVIEEIFRDVVPASYDVSFVRIGSSSSMAIINGQRVSVGDVIGGATVMAIDRGGVTQ